MLRNVSAAVVDVLDDIALHVECFKIIIMDANPDQAIRKRFEIARSIRNWGGPSNASTSRLPTSPAAGLKKTCPVNPGALVRLSAPTARPVAGSITLGSIQKIRPSGIL